MTIRATLLLAMATSVAVAAETGSFGKPLAGLPLSSLESVLAEPQNGQRVRLEGTIEKVCQQKGCWLELKQGESSVLVTFEDYSFFVPKGSAGRTVVLEGKVKVKARSPQEIAHLKAEGGGAGAAAKVSIEASGVVIGPAQ